MDISTQTSIHVGTKVGVVLVINYRRVVDGPEGTVVDLETM